MRKGKRGDTYNIGGNNEIENIKIVEMICDILDEIRKLEGIKSRKELIAFVKDRPGHDKRYAIDFSKLRHELDWMPEESFASGLCRTIEWYLDNTNWVNRVKSGEYQSWVESHYR